MAHVLLEKGLQSGMEIRDRLLAWGMTMGEWEGADPMRRWPGIEECDLAILEAATAEELSRNPQTVDSAGLAPVILLGVSGPLLLARSAWQGLPTGQLDHSQLMTAVQTGLDQAGLLRCSSGAREEREDFLSFLGHEMRSPLTAAKTALEVLYGDLGGLLDAPQDGSHLKMLDIALRNIRRLHRTVEWSHDLMGLSAREHGGSLVSLDAGQWQRLMSGSFPVEMDDGAAKARIHTDPETLSLVLEQAARALELLIPEGELRLEASLREDQPGNLVVELGVHDRRQGQTGHRVARLGLESNDTPSAPLTAELEKLVGFVISGTLSARLGLSVDVPAESAIRPKIRIRIPLAPDFSPAQEGVAHLLPSA